MTELEQTFTLTFTPDELRYLRELAGMVKFSDRPHGKFANDLYERLYQTLPEVLETSPFVPSNAGLAAVDWSANID